MIVLPSAGLIKSVVDIGICEVLRDEGVSVEDDNEDDDDLVNRLEKDVFHHSLRYDVFVSIVRLPIKQLWVRWLCRQCQRSERIHNQINPEHLDRGHDRFRYEHGCEEHCNNSHEINCELELQELPDGVVDVAAPHNCSDD